MRRVSRYRPAVRTQKYNAPGRPAASNTTERMPDPVHRWPASRQGARADQRHPGGTSRRGRIDDGRGGVERVRVILFEHGGAGNDAGDSTLTTSPVAVKRIPMLSAGVRTSSASTRTNPFRRSPSDRRVTRRVCLGGLQRRAPEVRCGRDRVDPAGIACVETERRLPARGQVVERPHDMRVSGSVDRLVKEP